MALSRVDGAPFRRGVDDERLDPGVIRAVVKRARDGLLPAARPGLCPELDCLRHLLPYEIIAAAERRARAIGIGADRVLICADTITEEAYLTALAASLETSYDALDEIVRSDCPLDDDQLLAAEAAGLLPVKKGDETIWIIAPRRLSARWLVNRRGTRSCWPHSFRLTSSERLRTFVMKHVHAALGRQAADRLRLTRPLFSSAPRWHWAGPMAAAALTLAAILAVMFAPAGAVEACGVLLCGVLLAGAAFSLSMGLYQPRASRPPPALKDRDLPIYSVLCPLDDEAKAASNLVAAIRALDYPPEKLDVKIIVEADDDDTRQALKELHLGAPFEIVIAPPVGPRSKAKALNAGLSLARGSITVVYDADDVPDPDQLRRAAAALGGADERLACLQASLTVDNTEDSRLACLDTASESGRFDAFLPALAAARLPFPLGGSSYHVRTAILRRVGGWDPYNETPAADLGIRLGRFGYRAGVLASTTSQETPAHLAAWLDRQTHRYKGAAQTWLVHLRRPLRLVRELTPIGAAAVQLVAAGDLLTVLLQPFLTLWLGYVLLVRPLTQPSGAANAAALLVLGTLLASYAAALTVELRGLQRRDLLDHSSTLVLVPLYSLLQSAAAWRALFELATGAHGRRKIAYGLATTSRRETAKAMKASRAAARESRTAQRGRGATSLAPLSDRTAIAAKEAMPPLRIIGTDNRPSAPRRPDHR